MALKPGDGVEMIDGCCAIARQDVGRRAIIHKQAEASFFDNWYCIDCGFTFHSGIMNNLGRSDTDWVHSIWLKKLPPDAFNETKEETKETANVS